MAQTTFYENNTSNGAFSSFSDPSNALARTVSHRGGRQSSDGLHESSGGPRMISKTGEIEGTGQRKTAEVASQMCGMVVVFRLPSYTGRVPNVRQKMTQRERAAYRQRRQISACESCVKAKSKCLHKGRALAHIAPRDESDAARKTITSAPGAEERPVVAWQTDQLRFFESILDFNMERLLRTHQLTVYREVLLANFHNAHFPNGIAARDEVVSKLQRYTARQYAPMSAAIDALLLFQLAYDTGNIPCRLESERLHRTALRRLRVTLAEANAADEDGLLVAIEAIGICEMYAGTMQADHIWSQHARGLATLVEVRGIQGLDSRLSRDVLSSALPLIIIDALHSRRSLFLGKPHWCNALRQWFPGRMSDLLRLGARIPELLEELERLKPLQRDPKELSFLLRAMARLERELNAWLLSWYAAEPTFNPMQAVKLAVFPDFVPLMEDSVKAFETVYTFPSLLHAMGHKYFWTFLFHLREGICEAGHLLTRDAEGKDHVCSQAEQAVSECADSLCRTVPFLSARHPRTTGEKRITVAPLRIAWNWYTHQGQVGKAGWCASAMEIGETRPEVTAMTLSGRAVEFKLSLPRAFAGWMLMAF